MKNPEVAFAGSPARSMSQRPPLAYMYMASFLEENNISTEIVDVKGVGNKEKAAKKVIKETVKLEPKIIGLSCLTPEVLDTRHLAAEIKKELPDVKILAGGVHPTLIPSDLIYKKSPIDFAVIGEGENTILELAKTIGTGKDFKKIKGIAFLRKDGKIVKTEPRPLIKDLSKMPMPAFDKIPMDYYTKPGIYCIRGIPISGFYVFTSRGCPYACRFCVNKNIFGRTVRYRDPVKVVDEIEILKNKYKIDGLYFYDDTFTVNRKHVETICKEMKERKLDMIWGCETRVNLVYEDLMKTMKDRGCVQIDFGVESGSPENLVRLRKEITVPQIENAFRICKKLGIRTFANFMINTPDETEKDVEMTLDLARRIDATVSIFNVTTLYPGNDIYEKMGGVPLKDYETLGPSPASYDAWISLLESKYKLSKHNLDLKKLLKEISEEFPTVHRLSLKNPKYVKKLAENFSAMLSPRYIKIILKSKRKHEYMKWLLQLSGFLKMQKNVVEKKKNKAK